MEVHDQSIENGDIRKLNDGNCLDVYIREINEIVREESEHGLPKTMSEDEHLMANGSDITYSQFKRHISERNLEGKTSTLNVNTQELNKELLRLTAVLQPAATVDSQSVELQKEHSLHHVDIDSGSDTSTLKQYIPECTNNVKRICETSNDTKKSKVSAEKNQISILDNTETKRDMYPNIAENIETGISCDISISVNPQTTDIQIPTTSGTSSSGPSVISNSSNSAQIKNYKNKLGVNRKKIKIQSDKNPMTSDLAKANEISRLDYCASGICSQSQAIMPNKSENHKKHMKTITSVVAPDGNKDDCMSHHKTSELSGIHSKIHSPEQLNKSIQSPINNESNMSNKTSELSEICPKIDPPAQMLKSIAKTSPSCVCPIICSSNHIADVTLNKSDVQSHMNPIKLTDSCNNLFSISQHEISDMQVHTWSKEKNIVDSDVETLYKNYEVPALKGTKRMKYKVLKKILKLLLQSPIKKTISGFMAKDPEMQMLLKGWKLKGLVHRSSACTSHCRKETMQDLSVYMKKHKTDSVDISNICVLCKQFKELERSDGINNLQNCVNKNIDDGDTICKYTKGTQTDFNSFSSESFKKKCKTRVKWINESCSDSEDEAAGILFIQQCHSLIQGRHDQMNSVQEKEYISSPAKYLRASEYKDPIQQLPGPSKRRNVKSTGKE